MFGLRIVKNSYIDKLKNDIDEALAYSERLKMECKEAKEEARILDERLRYSETLANSLDRDIKDKDSHIIKMGNELSKARELYDKSVNEKESLKRAYMDIDKKNKMSSRLLDEARRKYKELEMDNKRMSDKIRYLENHVDPEALDEVNDDTDEIKVDEEIMDPNSGHIDTPEVDNDVNVVENASGANINSEGNAGASNADDNAGNKKVSKKRKKSKKHE